MKYPCVIIASDIFCSSKYFPKHARWIRCSKIKKIVDTIFFNPNVCRMFVPEHKHPLMSTRNRLHVFPVDDAGALACSGLLWSGDGYTSPKRCGLKSKLMSAIFRIVSLQFFVLFRLSCKSEFHFVRVNSTLIRFFSIIEWTSCKFSSKSFLFLYFYEKRG